ncbi:MAG: c-type cytochrome [Acidobacteriaceae bacterium]|jgi:cytochrome c oxidase cbb3-type subunit 3/ubiquinol-cytochrome c reductase cytochrome c subunit
MNLSRLNSANLWLLACTISFALAGCRAAPGKPGPEPETPRPEQVLDFATLYGKNCAGCHGEDGRNGAAIALANPVYLAIAGTSNIQRITADGVPNTAMPPFARSKGGTLTDQQIAALTSGMISTWGNPSALRGCAYPAYESSVPGDVAHGKQAFADYCAQCHGADGTGGTSPSRQPAGSLIPPALKAAPVRTGSLVDPSYLALISDQGLRSVILAGQYDENPHDWREDVCPPTGLTFLDHQLSNVPDFNHEITDIVAWLASHRTATPGQVYQQHP